MKKSLLLLSVVLLVLAIFINNGILITLKSDSDAASFGVTLLLISIVTTILGIRKIGEEWNKRKKFTIQTISVFLIVILYLAASTLIIYSRSQNTSNENISTVTVDDDGLNSARNEFIDGLNKTLSTVSEQSNGFYSIIASFKDNNITLLYKINIENDISINDDPIDALVNETIKTYRDNGTIEIFKTLRFTTLTMTFAGKARENTRIINLNKI